MCTAAAWETSLSEYELQITFNKRTCRYSKGYLSVNREHHIVDVIDSMFYNKLIIQCIMFAVEHWVGEIQGLKYLEFPKRLDLIL